MGARDLAPSVALGLLAAATAAAVVAALRAWLGACGGQPCTYHLGALAFVLAFAAFPAAAAIAFHRRRRALMLAAVGAYLVLALLFGFSAGGPHLTSGVPLALLGAALGAWSLRGGAAGAPEQRSAT
jgi:hypothetical protein